VRRTLRAWVFGLEVESTSKLRPRANFWLARRVLYVWTHAERIARGTKEGFQMTAITRSMFSFATLLLALSANACAVSGARSVQSGAFDKTCEGGTIASAADATRFSGCTSVHGSLRVSSAELEDLSALSALRTVSGTLEIADNSELDDLSGLEQLQQVGSLSIHDNAELDDLSGLEQLHQARALVISDNAELTSLRGLSGLTRVEQLVLDHNGLYQTAGMSSLTEVGQLVIVNNPRLNSLQGLHALMHARSVEIRKNPRLCARGMLPALSHVDGELTVSDNRGLSQPDVHQLLGRIEHGALPAAAEGVAQLDASLH